MIFRSPPLDSFSNESFEDTYWDQERLDKAMSHRASMFPNAGRVEKEDGEGLDAFLCSLTRLSKA